MPQRERDVVENAQVGKQVVALKNHADLTSNGVLVDAGEAYVITLEPNLAVADFFNQVDATQHRAFA